MGHHIRALSLEGKLFDRYIRVGDGLRLRTLSKINLFVGANNSGKSRFLRGLAAIKTLSIVPEENYDRVAQIMQSLHNGLKTACISYNADDANGFVQQSGALAANVVFREDVDLFKPLDDLFKDILGQGMLNTVKGNYGNQGDHPRLRQAFHAMAAPLAEEFESLKQTLPRQYRFKRVYIPTLRGLRCFGSSDDIYEKRTRTDYFNDAAHVEIFTGLTLYAELRKLLLGTYSDRQAAARFEQFLSHAFFEGHPVTLIPREDQDVIDVKIGDEPQLPIFNLGDGIQSIIILTFPLFRDRGENLLLFIEEPELFLHPGLQRVFLTVLQREEFTNAQYFFATHSNHLLDLSLDVENISVFNFRKKLDDEESPERSAWITVENVSNEDERSL